MIPINKTSISACLIATILTIHAAFAKPNKQNAMHTASAASITTPATDHTTATHGFLNTPAFSLGGYGDTTLGFVLTTKAASYLGSNQQHAAALELDGGSRLIRINATYAVALTDHQWVKTTFEHLDERLDFDFVLQDASEWVLQNAVVAVMRIPSIMRG